VALDVPDRLACPAIEELLRVVVEAEPVRDVERRFDPAPCERGEKVAERSLEPRRPQVWRWISTRSERMRRMLSRVPDTASWRIERVAEGICGSAEPAAALSE
jgi:hypothetical protein